MPEGDTIHRIARRIELALAGREVSAAAPNPRSPIHHRANELAGRTVAGAEAYGKHLVIHLSGDRVIHSHLGINGRFRVEAGAAPPPRPAPWLLLSGEGRFAIQVGGKILRIVSESRARNDPLLARLGPDPLRPGFDLDGAAQRLRAMGAGRAVGEALLDQEIVAGIGNAISIGACFAARVSPWRPVDELSTDDARRLIAESLRIMRIAVESGHRPRSVYGSVRRGCPRCGGRVSVRGQGDANRATYWCPSCQPR
ncbi:MAG TPA: DNA-formamidopyrimidine glycosylase family protein [Solirubrobacterales bacterium]|nr:DNA-formamidopyrimidine glycosylase family protein [Solirubrobacterales bacterium]